MKKRVVVVLGSIVTRRKIVVNVLQVLQKILLITVGLLAGGVKAFISLQPIDLPSIEFYTVDMLRQAALPSDLDNTLSIGHLNNMHRVELIVNVAVYIEISRICHRKIYFGG